MNPHELNARKKKLRKVFQEILQEHPQGVWNCNVWQLASQKLHSSVCASDYGVKKMSDMFMEFSDLYVEEQRGKNIYLRLKKTKSLKPDYIVVSSLSDESDDSDTPDPLISTKHKLHKKTSMPPPLESLTVYKSVKPSSDLKAKQSPKELERLEKLKENLVKLLNEENGSLSKNKIWNKYNKRFPNPRTKDYGINKMDEVYSLFSDVIKQEGEMIKLKKPTTSQVDSKSSAAPVWGQGAVGINPWGQGAVKGKASKQGFASSSSSESLDNLEDYPNLSRGPHQKNHDQHSRGSSKEPTQTSQDHFSDRASSHREERGYRSHSRESSHSRGSSLGSRDQDEGRDLGSNTGGNIKPLMDITVPGPPSAGLIQPVYNPFLQARSMQNLMSAYNPLPIQPMIIGSRVPNPTCSPLVFLGSTGTPRSSGSSLVRPPSSMMNKDSVIQTVVMPSPLDRMASKPPVMSSSVAAMNKDETSTANYPANIPAPAVKKDVTVKPIVLGRGQSLSFDQLDSIVNDCIDILSDAEEYVSPGRVEQLLLMRFSRNNLRELNSNLRYVDQLKSVNEHVRLINKVNLYVHAFVKCRCICTVYELTQCMKEFTREDSEFKSLRVGPIQKMPVVYDLFKFPADGEIIEITTIDILEHLRKYMDVKQKWMERLDMEDVMKYLVEMYSVDSAYALGVRIRSLPLCVQMIKKSQRDAAATRRSVTESCKEELFKEISGAFHKFSRSVFQRGEDGQSEVREHYLKLTPEVVIMEIIQKFHLLMLIDEPTTKFERKQYMKLRDSIHNFLIIIVEHKMAKALFHLAICVSNSMLQESAMEFMKPPVSKSEEAGTSGETTSARQPPSKGEILERLKKYLDNCLASGSISLKNLERIEEKLLEDYCFPTFHAFGFGPFLRFLLSDSSAKHLLDECGGTAFGSSSGGHEGDSIYRPQMTNLLEFIRQSKNAGISEPEIIEGALKNQFSTPDIKQLGHGNIHRLITAADKPGKHKAKEYRVIYEAAVCDKNRGDLGQKRVGVMGNMTRDQALICLHNCPLLVDLENFSHWSLVFEPEHGKLKEFIQKYGGLHTVSLEGGRRTVTTDVQALEVKPGKLLKVVSRTSNEKFEKVLEQQDVIGTCGHLVSLIVSNKGLENMPLALMANHMKTALFKLHASGASVGASPGAPPLESSEMDPAVSFVLDCLVVLPLRICLAIADQMFLETLGKVIGSTKSKTSLLRACQTRQQRHRLEKLACLLGVQEWVDGIHDRCKPLDEDVIMEITEEEEQYENLMMFSESESDSDSESTASIPSILSDDEIEADEDEVVEVSEESKPEDVITPEDKEEEEIMVVSTEEEDEEEEDDDKDVVTILTESEDEEIEINVCKQEVEQIRRNEFGIGIRLDEDGERLMKVQQERLGRSLDRLSKDLYSKDTHFVLELVQNADDNSYPEEMLQNGSSTCPTVKFIMDDQGVVVLNNECGFKENNIRALCDVGRSTKGKHKFGYIGQKGIGFKSVFRVTDRPEIHSNGYHICFDVKSGPMGYIVPHWLDDAEELDESWVTKISLPLKPEMLSQTRSLAARFNDIHQSLLLFLHRLKQMIIENKIENSSLVMRRRDLAENIIEIEYNGKIDRWLVAKKMLDASNISLQAKSGIDVESTEIAIAFPLKSKEHKLYSQALPPKQPVFAFLPLRSYGFRFIIQGDFDVPSSREDVDRDSPWNQWLRNEIHVLFIEALEKFKSLEEFTELEALATFLRFVPLEDEILDFFRPVSSSILQKLKAKECLPVQTSKKGSVLWKIPSQTVIVTDSLIKEVISPELLQKHLNLYYLHEDLAASLSLSLSQSLGVEQITVEHLLNIGKTLSQSWDSSSDNNDQVITVSKWLACLYRSLDEFHENTTVFDSLRAMKIIPLSTKKLISLDEMTVFLPPGDGSAEKKGLSGARDPLGKLQQDLSMIHSGLVTTSDNEVNSQVLKLLQRAGVKQLSPFDIVHHHILPILKSDQWQNKTRDTLISYTIYIKEQLNRESTLINVAELKSVVRVATNHGMKNPAEDAVHFTTAFGNDIDLLNCFPGYNWVLLDSVYVMGCNKLAVMQWHQFFTQLGVTDFLSVKSVSVHITKTDMADSPWAPLESMWQECEDGYYIEDFACEEFHSLVTRNLCPEKLAQQMKILFEILEQRWDKQYSAFTTVQVKNKTGSVLIPTEDSSFSIHLRTLKWVPALQLALESTPRGLQLTRSVIIMQPSLLYANSPLLMNILGHMVMYLQPEINTRSLFAPFLRIKTKVDMKTVKELLIEAGSRSDKTTPATFKTSMTHVKCIYQYLYDNLPPKELQDLFHEHSVIFIPDVKCPVDMFVPGRMFGRDELWWEDQTGLFDSYHSSLTDFHSSLANKFLVKPLYMDCEEMFKRGVRMQIFPSLSEYAQLMLHITSTNSPTEVSALVDVLNIFRLIGIAVMDQNPDATPSAQSLSHNIEMEKVKKLLKKQQFLPTRKDVWVGLDDKPMISDSKELENLFIEQPQVHLLQLTEKVEKGKGRKSQQKDSGRKMEIALVFVSLFDIPNLSDCVVTEQTTEMTQPCHKVQLYMHKITPVIQKFLSSEFNSVYQSLISERNIATELTEISFWQVLHLEVVYSLKDKDDIRIIRQEKCMLTEQKFYFDKDHTKSFPDINREIAKFFSCGNDDCFKQLRLFLTDLCTTIDDINGIEELLVRNSIEALPPDEEEWNVPAPIEVLPPVVRHTPVPVKPEEAAQPEGSDGKGEVRETGLKSWPPQSSVVSLPRKDGEKEAVSKMWPPPKPSGFQRDFHDLPSRIKIDREPSDVPSGERREAGETTGEHSKEVKHQYSEDSRGRQVLRQDSGGEDLGIGENRKRKLHDQVIDRQSKRPAQEEHEVHGDRQQQTHPATEGPLLPPGGVTAPPGGVTAASVGDRGDGNATESDKPEHREGTPITNKRRTPDSDAEIGVSPKRPVYFRGDPVWSDTASELIYEELGSGTTLKLPEFPVETEVDKTTNEKTGRWGEQVVHDYLLQQKERHQDISQVIWVNEAIESGLPYDFEIVLINGEEKKSLYVEVKSTLLNTKYQFEISANEIMFALDHKDSYQIYRIFNAGKPDCVRLVRIDNVALKMDQSTVKLFMYI